LLLACCIAYNIKRIVGPIALEKNLVLRFIVMEISLFLRKSIGATLLQMPATYKFRCDIQTPAFYT
jgi:hypothetical protein